LDLISVRSSSQGFWSGNNKVTDIVCLDPFKMSHMHRHIESGCPN
jgi:hypothetical protein